MTPAEKMRAYRRRQRQGMISSTVNVPHVELVELLIEHGVLDPEDEDNRRAIASALESLLRSMFDRYR